MDRCGGARTAEPLAKDLRVGPPALLPGPPSRARPTLPGRSAPHFIALLSHHEIGVRSHALARGDDDSDDASGSKPTALTSSLRRSADRAPARGPRGRLPSGPRERMSRFLGRSEGADVSAAVRGVDLAGVQKENPLLKIGGRKANSRASARKASLPELSLRESPKSPRLGKDSSPAESEAAAAAASAAASLAAEVGEPTPPTSCPDRLRRGCRACTCPACCLPETRTARGWIACVWQHPALWFSLALAAFVLFFVSVLTRERSFVAFLTLAIVPAAFVTSVCLTSYACCCVLRGRWGGNQLLLGGPPCLGLSGLVVGAFLYVAATPDLLQLVATQPTDVSVASVEPNADFSAYFFNDGFIDWCVLPSWSSVLPLRAHKRNPRSFALALALALATSSNVRRSLAGQAVVRTCSNCPARTPTFVVAAPVFATPFNRSALVHEALWASSSPPLANEPFPVLFNATVVGWAFQVVPVPVAPPPQPLVPEGFLPRCERWAPGLCGWNWTVWTNEEVGDSVERLAIQTAARSAFRASNESVALAQFEALANPDDPLVRVVQLAIDTNAYDFWIGLADPSAERARLTERALAGGLTVGLLWLVGFALFVALFFVRASCDAHGLCQRKCHPCCVRLVCESLPEAWLACPSAASPAAPSRTPPALDDGPDDSPADARRIRRPT